jgi:protein phosphatase
MPAVCAARSDVGCKRDFNEDFYAVDPERGLFVVADGLGGHVAGRRASEIGVQAFMTACAASAQGSALARMRDAVREANRAIRARVEAEPALKGMGTTLVALEVGGAQAALVHVGDSRAYLWRAARLHPLTLDHSVVADLVAYRRLSPEAAQRHPQRHVITRALGVQAALEPDAATLRVEPGDLFLLCTDGISAALGEGEIAGALAASGPDLERAADLLIALANQHGGEDNATAVLVRL